MDTAAVIQVGNRVVWHAQINWRVFGQKYTSPVCIVTAVSKRTIHIQLTRTNGSTVQKWVKRNRVRLCVIQDREQADLDARRSISWTY